jgi:RNA methyltransferase, TrmH family
MLDNPRSERVKELSKLSQKDARTESGLFLLEGPQGLKELALRPELAQEVFVTEAAAERYAKQLSSLAEVTLVSERVLQKIADTKTPQGVVAVVRQPSAKLESVLAAKPKLIAILEQVRDPGNAGTVIRAADAAGADAVLITADSVDLFNPKLVRSTAGSILHLPIVQGVELASAVSQLKGQGVQVLATSGLGEPLPAQRSELGKPTAWLFGNEAQGLSTEAMALADKVLALPIYGSAESLNLATAAAVCLYASAFEQASKH